MLQQLRVHPDNAPPRRRLIPLSWIIREFIDLCVTTTMKESDSHWLDIAAQLTAQAIAEEFWIFASVSSEELHGRLIWVPSDPSMTVEWDRLCEKYMNRLQLPPDTPWEVRPEETPTALPLYHLEEVVIDFLLNLMKSLDAPVLVQLERGKLGGLTRAETQSLKDRIGI